MQADVGGQKSGPPCSGFPNNVVRMTAKSCLVSLGMAQSNGILETHSGFGEKTIHMENWEEIRRLHQVISDNDPNSEAVRYQEDGHGGCKRLTGLKFTRQKQIQM